MSLSTKPRGAITSYQVILEIAQLLRDLQSDPKTLETAAKEAYALPSAEAAKAVEAKENIEKYEKLIATYQEQRKPLEDAMILFEAKKAEFVDQQAKFNQENLNLADYKSKLEQKQKACEAKSDELAKVEDELIREKAKAVVLQETLRLKLQEVSVYQASLKEKAEKLKGLTEGL